MHGCRPDEGGTTDVLRGVTITFDLMERCDVGAVRGAVVESNGHFYVDKKRTANVLLLGASNKGRNDLIHPFGIVYVA
jgi:hypothetical protein